MKDRTSASYEYELLERFGRI